MKRLLSAVACLVTLNLVGCCCMSPRIDECGPHPSDLAGGGGCLAKFARSHGAKKKCGCGHCGGGMYADPVYGMPYSGDCCGGGCDTGMGGMIGGYPGMSSGGGCGCSGGGGGMMAPSMPAAPAATQYAPEGSPTPAPMPEPQAAPETAVPPVPGAETPAPPMTYQPAPGQPGVQNVSMEEFQRLPGTIISGPTTSPVAAPQAAMAPAIHSPVMTRTPIPTIANPGVRPANWQPARAQ